MKRAETITAKDLASKAPLNNKRRGNIRIMITIDGKLVLRPSQVTTWLPKVPTLTKPKGRKASHTCPCGVFRCKHGRGCRILLTVPI